ncbi:MAG: DUF4301 family protein [Cryomorphaceae bacterium]|nr:MAG: DUF4301 family protein [Cryomorphaceae bacterium]
MPFVAKISISPSCRPTWAKVLNSCAETETVQFTEKDIQQLAARGITANQAAEQVTQLRKGFPGIRLTGPALVGDGIVALSESRADEYMESFNEAATHLNLLKFVPASGAATRMFKALFEGGDGQSAERKEVRENIREFAFYPALKQVAEKQGIGEGQLASLPSQKLFNLMLEPDGMGFGQLPKGMIPFHRYGNTARTAFEEHLHEGLHHSCGVDDKVRIHFTVQQDFLADIQAKLQSEADAISSKTSKQFELSFSVQSSATDTLAIDANGEPVRNPDGSLLFRPGGHGALIHNLNALSAELIFVKNIDNVVSDRHKYQGIRYKMVLAGLALDLHRRIVKYQRAIALGRTPVELCREIQHFLQEYFFLETPEGMCNRGSRREFVAWVHPILNRPLRVCGMVRNEGEPGGGPFWVHDEHTGRSLQIVEKSQINTTDATQRDMLEAATHFNPVDLVCMTRDYTGKAYNLLQFVDPQTGFVSEKSHQGQTIRALELPGLWNGAMANWNTVFVEVPASTFSPVKTVNDLLRPLHG